MFPHTQGAGDSARFGSGETVYHLLIVNQVHNVIIVEVAGLLEVHIITDEATAKSTSYAVKIGAVTDAARELPLGGAASPAK